jgi:hypothetical protein
MINTSDIDSYEKHKKEIDILVYHYTPTYRISFIFFVNKQIRILSKATVERQPDNNHNETRPVPGVLSLKLKNRQQNINKENGWGYGLSG